MKPGDILKNPDDPSKTYTVGQRGRRPGWVQAIMEKEDYVRSKPEKADAPTERTEFQLWIYVNDGFMYHKICIVARDINHAVRVATPTFKYPFFRNELEGEGWEQSPYEGDLAPGIYQKNGADEWMPRLAVREVLG
jgi:hypothetical protein